MAVFIFLTGAAGAGKSHITREVEQLLGPKASSMFLFDEIGVPTPEEIAAQFGTSEKWQEQAAHEWVRKLIEHHLENPQKKILLLEGSYNPQFVIDACEQQGIKNPLLLVAHASRPIREGRLKEIRRQPELATLEMQNWADFLRKKTLELEGHVIDTTLPDPMRGVEQLLVAINQRLKSPASSAA